MKKSRTKGWNGGLVYSTEHGKMCPGCAQPMTDCICRMKEAVSSGDGIVRIGRQTKGRKGKGVTLVTGLTLGQKDLKDLAKKLKQRCGSGGTVKDGIIEIQGDHREVLIEELRKQGWTVKGMGG